MRFAFLLIFATCFFLRPVISCADETAKQVPGTQLTGSWMLVSWLTKFDGGDTVEPYGPNPRGRLVITPGGQLIIILTGANRVPAKSNDDKAALLDSMLAYSGRYTVAGNQITTHVDMSSNEIYSGANQNQIRFFTVDGDKLTLRTPEIVSAVRPGQKAVGTLIFAREH
jgi:hypothetical protein